MNPLPSRLSIREFARLHRHSPTTVLRWRKRELGYQPDENGDLVFGLVRCKDGKVRPSRRYFSYPRDEDFVRRRLAGQTFRQIADETGWSVGTVHRVVGGPVELEALLARAVSPRGMGPKQAARLRVELAGGV